MTSTRGPKEFFFLEYRTPNQMGSGAFDREVNSEGLAIWHVLTDAKKRPQKISWPTGSTTTFPTVFLEGMPQQNPPSAPPGPVGFTRAGNVAWKIGTVTPTLRWWDGSTTNLRLASRWYPVGALNILVDAYPERINLPISSQLVSPIVAHIKCFGQVSRETYWLVFVTYSSSVIGRRRRR